MNSNETNPPNISSCDAEKANEAPKDLDAVPNTVDFDNLTESQLEVLKNGGTVSQVGADGSYSDIVCMRVTF